MARVTVEDCVVYVADRFELVVLAAQRARDIGSGASLTVDRGNDKNPVVSLREIAENRVSLDGLRESVLGSFQRCVEVIDSSADVCAFLHEEEGAWVSSSSLEKDLASNNFSEEEDSSGGGSNLYS